MGKKKKSNTEKGKRYRAENRRFKNKVRKLFNRFKRYKEQPPKALNGIIDVVMRNEVKKKLELYAKS